MANKITLNETSYFGKGAIQEIVTEVKNRGCHHVTVITDKDLMKFKVATKITDLFDTNGITYTVYDRINPIRPFKMFRIGVAFCKDAKT